MKEEEDGWSIHPQRMQRTLRLRNAIFMLVLSLGIQMEN
jgi:hypothetical protein